MLVHHCQGLGDDAQSGTLLSLLADIESPAVIQHGNHGIARLLSAYLYLQDLPSLPASQPVNQGILYENLDKHRRDIRILHIHFGIYLQREIEIIAHQRSFHRQILLHETELCGQRYLRLAGQVQVAAYQPGKPHQFVGFRRTGMQDLVGAVSAYPG